jgi:hypothetical protein
MYKSAPISKTISSFLAPLVPGIFRSGTRFPQLNRRSTGVADTVDDFLSHLSMQDRAMLKAARKEDLLIFRRKLAERIIKNYGQNKRKEELRFGIYGARRNANEVAMKVIESAWAILQKN